MFGSGVGDYLIQKMAGFGEEKARWANCSAEEWRDGTKGLCVCLILEFVKYSSRGFH